MPEYKVGDKVEYHPIGGASDNVSSSRGEIVEVQGSGEEMRYGIKNNNTGKVTREEYYREDIVETLKAAFVTVTLFD